MARDAGDDWDGEGRESLGVSGEGTAVTRIWLNKRRDFPHLCPWIGDGKQCAICQWANNHLRKAWKLRVQR